MTKISKKDETKWSAAGGSGNEDLPVSRCCGGTTLDDAAECPSQVKTKKVKSERKPRKKRSTEPAGLSCGSAPVEKKRTRRFTTDKPTGFVSKCGPVRRSSRNLKKDKDESGSKAQKRKITEDEDEKPKPKRRKVEEITDICVPRRREKVRASRPKKRSVKPKSKESCGPKARTTAETSPKRTRKQKVVARSRYDPKETSGSEGCAPLSKKKSTKKTSQEKDSGDKKC